MRWVEQLNLAAGFILVIVGVIYFFKGDYLTGFSWLIFGSMYLVMDSYQQVREENKSENRVIILRKLFSIVGFLAATALIIYAVAI